MDALTLLHEVSEAYRNLQRLVVEATLIDESGDEHANQRGERRVRFFFAAPDRMRFEPSGKGRALEVLDGAHWHQVLARHLGQKRYASVPIARMHRFPHLFDPRWPVNLESLLFQGIDQQVASAEILREEQGCTVVAVEFERRPQDQGIMVTGSAVRFWIDRRNHTVMRLEGETGHRLPTEDEVRWSRHAMVVREMRVNQPIAEETFHFTPPADAVEEGGGQGGAGFGGGGGGFIERGPDGKDRLEFRGSHEWQDETLVEHGRWKIRGMLLQFERRLTFSEDGTEVHVAERITGPKGEAETSCKLPVA